MSRKQVRDVQRTPLVLIKVRCPEYGEQQKNLDIHRISHCISIWVVRAIYLLATANLPECSEFSTPRVLSNNLHFTAVASLNLLRASEKNRKGHSKTLQSHENEICFWYFSVSARSRRHGSFVLPAPTFPLLFDAAELTTSASPPRHTIRLRKILTDSTQGQWPRRVKAHQFGTRAIYYT